MIHDNKHLARNDGQNAVRGGGVGREDNKGERDFFLGGSKWSMIEEKRKGVKVKGERERERERERWLGAVAKL